MGSAARATLCVSVTLVRGRAGLVRAALGCAATCLGVPWCSPARAFRGLEKEVGEVQRTKDRLLPRALLLELDGRCVRSPPS